MGQVSRSTLKTYFETRDQPTEAQFIDLIDSSARSFIDASAYNSLQAAIDAASPGDVVHAYGQSYTLSSTVNISTEDVVLNLHTSSIKIADNADIDGIQVTGDRSGVIGGRINGNRANQPGTTNRAMIQLEGAADSFARNIYITNPDGYGIRARNSPRAQIKDNIVIDSSFYAIYTVSNSVDIEGASITGNYVDRRSLGPLSSGDGGGIVVHSDTGTPITDTFRQSGGRVIDNTVYLDEGSTANECFIVGGNRYSFSNNYGFGGSIGVTLYGDYGACDSNIFEDNNDWGIEFTRSYKLSITGNLVQGNGNTQNGISQNADASGRSTHVTISGNVVENCTQANYWVQYCDHSSVNGNSCINGRMLLRDCDGLSVVGNVWDDNGQAGNMAVLADEQENFIFMGNYIGMPNVTNAIRFTSSDGSFTPDDITIIGNYFDVSGQLIVTSGLSSGAIGENWVFKDNTGPALLARENYLNYKDDRKFIEKDEDPSSAGESAGQGSLFVDTTNNKLYIKTGSGNTDWTVVGTQS